MIAHTLACGKFLGNPNVLVTVWVDNPAFTEDSLVVATHYTINQINLKVAEHKYGVKAGTAASKELIQAHQSGLESRVQERPCTRGASASR